jgi:NAD-dependent dihydropyrimidine dehydrogenase PreA subunit
MLGKPYDHPVPYISDEKSCTGCEACLKACPQSALLAQTIAELNNPDKTYKLQPLTRL